MFGTRTPKKNEQPNQAAPLANITKTISQIQDTVANDLGANDHRANPTAKSAPAQNIIGKGTIIDGNLSAEGDLFVEGIVRGDVLTKTSLIVGPGALIEGNLSAQHAEISGRVNGTVQSSGLLTIKASGIIDGDVITKNLNVESGSTFNGRFKVGGAAPTAQKSESMPTAAEKMAPYTKL